MLITQENLEKYKLELIKTREIAYNWLFGPLVKTETNNPKIKNKDIEITAQNRENSLSIFCKKDPIL
jgi:hypothetical protein